MEKVTSETIKANFPQIWWEIYRTGFREAMESPEMQAQAAKMHLERTLTKPSPAQPAPQPQTVQSSDVQTAINAQMGISPEIFAKFAHVH